MCAGIHVELNEVLIVQFIMIFVENLITKKLLQNFIVSVALCCSFIKRSSFLSHYTKTFRKSVKTLSDDKK